MHATITTPPTFTLHGWSDGGVETWTDFIPQGDGTVRIVSRVGSRLYFVRDNPRRDGTMVCHECVRPLAAARKLYAEAVQRGETRVK